MGKITREIEITTDDPIYGEALGISLAMHFNGITVKIRQNDSDFDNDYFSVAGKRIYKYMSIYAIASEIEAAIGELFKRNKILQDRIIIGIVGMRGGCGTSSIAEGLARTFSLFHGREVLEISTGNFGYEFSRQSRLLPLGSLIYREDILESEKVSNQISQYAARDEYGVWHVAIDNCQNPFNVENAEYMSSFIEKLSGRLNNNLTILDLGSAADMNLEKMKILSKTDRAFAIISAECDIERVKCFENIVSRVSGDYNGFSFEKVIVNHLNPNTYKIEEDHGISEDENVVLEYSPESFLSDENGAKIDLSFGFGISIEKLANNLLEM